MEKREKYEWHHCCSMIASRCWKSPLSTPHSKAKCIIQVRWARSGSFFPRSLSANSNKFVNKVFLYYSTCAALMWKCARFLSVWLVHKQNAFNEVLFAMEFLSSARFFRSWLMIVYKRKKQEVEGKISTFDFIHFLAFSFRNKWTRAGCFFAVLMFRCVFVSEQLFVPPLH